MVEHNPLLFPWRYEEKALSPGLQVQVQVTDCCGGIVASNICRSSSVLPLVRRQYKAIAALPQLVDAIQNHDRMAHTQGPDRGRDFLREALRQAGIVPSF